MEAAGNPKQYRNGYEADLALGLTYLKRLMARMATCACEFLVTLEDDVCVRRPAVPPPRTGAARPRGEEAWRRRR